MKRTLLWLAVLVIAAQGPARAARFEEFFTGRTLRLELSRLFGAAGDHVSIDRVRVEGLWPGSRTRLLDSTNLGDFFFEIVDLQTETPLYSRGVGSAHRAASAFPRSLRFPEPRLPFLVRLSRRLPDQSFDVIWTGAFDPQSPIVERSEIVPRPTWVLFESGPALSKVDLLILGEGYTADELPRYHADVGRLVESLFSLEPFASRRASFNVRVVDTPSASTGIARRGSDEETASALGAVLDTDASGSDRLTFEGLAWREAATVLPNDFIIILVNSRQDLSVGSFQQFAAVAARSPMSHLLLAHQFGHHFAGLGDEHGSDENSATEPLLDPTQRHEPWEPNITALLDPEAVKWQRLADPETPLPTSWNRAPFEEQLARMHGEGSVEDLTSIDLLTLPPDGKAVLKELLGSEEFAGAVGAFEGIGADADRYYRPSPDCVMYTGGEGGYCKVCQHAIDRVIRLYTQ